MSKYIDMRIYNGYLSFMCDSLLQCCSNLKHGNDYKEKHKFQYNISMLM